MPAFMTRNILYVGNFKYPHCTEVHYARSFRELGHIVTCVQEEIVATDPRMLLALATDHDLVLYTRTPPGLPPQTTEVWRELEQRGILTASVHLDLFFGLRRDINMRTDPLFQTGIVFTADGDHDQEWVNLGIFHWWLRPGVLRAECVDGRTKARLADTSVAFVGSGQSNGRGYHREWPHRADLLRHLEVTYGRQFVRYGGAGRASTLRGDDLNDLYRSVPIVVGDTLSQQRAASRYWSDRVYETWGRGGFLLFPRIDALNAEFYPNDSTGTELPGYDFDDFVGLDAMIDYWLRHAEAREALRRRIQQHVRDHCTYTHRAAEILWTVGLAGSTVEQLEPLGIPDRIRVPLKEH